jgi:hypothetical protein
MTDDLLKTFRADVPLPDEATARRIHSRATSRRRRLPRRRLILILAVATAIAAPAAVLGSGILHRQPNPRSVASRLQQEFLAYVVNAAREDPGPRFPHPRRRSLLRQLERNSTRFRYRIRHVEVVRGRDGAPLIVLRATGSVATFSKSVGSLYRLLDPLSRRPRITSDTGARIDHTKWEAFFLEAEDRKGVPFLVVWNVWRQPQGGGGQWAREESLLPFEHG